MSDWLPRESERGLVSVIIPTHNRAHLISETLDSVLGQTHTQVEVLVVDDGSTDGTRGAIEEFKRTRSAGHIRYSWQGKAGGPRARNQGMAKSRGEFIQFLDSDDLLHPEKLAVQVALLKRRSDLDFVVAQRITFTSRDELGDEASHRQVPVGPITLESFFAGASFVTLQPLFRRTSLIPVGPWDERLDCSQEANYFGRALVHGLQGEFIPEVLCYKRLHPGNIRSTIDRKSLMAGMVRCMEGVCREADRQGVRVPRVLKYHTLRYRSRRKACLGDARSGLSDLLDARQLVPPEAVLERIELAVRSWLLRIAGPAAYTVICDSLHAWKRKVAATKSRKRNSLVGHIASCLWERAGGPERALGGCRSGGAVRGEDRCREPWRGTDGSASRQAPDQGPPACPTSEGVTSGRG